MRIGEQSRLGFAVGTRDVLLLGCISGLADEQTILEVGISDSGSSDCLTFKNVTSFVSS